MALCVAKARRAGHAETHTLLKGLSKRCLVFNIGAPPPGLPCEYPVQSEMSGEWFPAWRFLQPCLCDGSSTVKSCRYQARRADAEGSRLHQEGEKVTSPDTATAEKAFACSVLFTSGSASWSMRHISSHCLGGRKKKTDKEPEANPCGLKVEPEVGFKKRPAKVRLRRRAIARLARHSDMDRCSLHAGLGTVVFPLLRSARNAVITRFGT